MIRDPSVWVATGNAQQQIHRRGGGWTIFPPVGALYRLAHTRRRPACLKRAREVDVITVTELLPKLYSLVSAALLTPEEKRCTTT